jgi:dihydroorotate dehydrogenase electron transfer subunit
MDKMYQSMWIGEILENRSVAPEHFQMRLQLPSSFSAPMPGQFVMIREATRQEPLLARPLSISGFHRSGDAAVLDLLYRTAGRGTLLFSGMKPGESIALFGPLGKGFTIPEGIGRVLLVAGGVGVAPLLFLLQSAIIPEETQKTFYLGARSRDLLMGMDRLADYCELGICTDDGSAGYEGPVTDLLGEEIRRYDPKHTLICACGPMPMIRSLKRLLAEHPIPCQVSLEERMACGLGACLGCVVTVRIGTGKKEYLRVCKEGPVFDIAEVIPVFKTACAGCENG